MATGGEFSTSFSQCSDESFNFICTLCAKDGVTVEAFKQCFDCDEFFCGKCFRFHNKMDSMAGHKVVDKKHMRTVPGSKPTLPLPTQRCPVHGERITTHCSDHDVICCTRCVDISHINCDGITYIVDVAQGIKSDDQIQTTYDNIAATLNNLKTEMVSCKKYMATLDNDNRVHVKQVMDLTARLIKRIRELKNITINHIDSNHKEQSDKARNDIAHLNDAISVMEEDLKNLEQSQQNSESTVFVDVKLGQRHEAKGRNILQNVSAHHKAGLKLVLNTTVEQFLNDLTTLGNLIDGNKACTAKLNGDYDIKVQQDTDTCNILGSCLLSDGTMVVSDYKNKRIKRLDTTYRVTDYCDMPSGTWGITCMASDEVAVTLPTLKKVQFVSVRDCMTMTRSFSTSDTCRGICYSTGELFVSCGGLITKDTEERPGHVSVYSLNGEHLHSIQTDPTGQQIFRCPYHITASSDGARIYVADYKGGVVSSDRSGKSVCSFADPSLKHAMGLCILDNGHLLVCGWESYNVIEFDSDGRKTATMLRDTGGIHAARSLCYNSHNSTLVVTMKDTNKIKVFDLA